MGVMDRYAEKKKKAEEDSSTKSTASGGVAERYAQKQRYQTLDTSSVNEAYINDFSKNTSDFFDKFASDSISYGESSKAMEDLRSRHDMIQGWLVQNKGNLDADSYNNISSYLDNVKSNLDGVRDYYAQWANEDEYKKYEQHMQYMSYLENLDLDAQKKKAEELDKVAGASRPTNYFADTPQDSSAGYFDVAPETYQASQKTKEETEADLAWKDYNLAKSLQYSIAGEQALDALNDDVYADVDKLAQAWLSPDIYNTIAQGSTERLRSAGYTDAEIEQLVDYRKRQINRSEYDEKVAKTEELANNGFWGATGASAASVPQQLLSGAGYIDLALQKLQNAYSGNDRPLDYYTQAMGFYGQSNAARTTVAQNIEESAKTELRGKIGSFFYNTGMSIADFISVAPLGGAGMALLGSGAATATAVDIRDRGGDDTQALLGGALAGAAEAVFENESLKSLFALSKPVAKETLRSGFKRVLTNVGKQGWEEGKEELFTTLANAMTDRMVMGDLSSYNTAIRDYMAQGLSEEEAERKATLDFIVQCATDTLAGFVSGGVMGGVSTAARSYANYSSYDAKDLVDEALEINPENTYAQGIKAKLDEGKRVGVGARYKLVQQNEAAMLAQDTATIEAAVTKRLESLGESENVAAISKAIAKQASGETLTNEEKAVVQNSKYGQQVVDELNPANSKSGDYDTGWTRKIGTDKVNYEAYNADLLALADEVEGASKGIDIESVAPDTTHSTASQNGNAESAEAASVENGEQTKDKDIALIRSSLTDMGINAAGAEALMKNYDGTGGRAYGAGIALAYQYGKMNFPKSYLVQASLKPYQAELAYNLGRSDAKAEIYAPKVKRVVKGKQGTITYETAVDRTALNNAQNASLDGIEAIVALTNLDVHVFMSDKNNGFRYTMPDGAVRSANGWYVPGTNEIWIDINAGNTGEGTMLYTFAHEITHYIKEWSPKKWRELADFLLEQYGNKNVPVTELLQMQMDKISNRDSSLTGNKLKDAAYEELVSDAMSEMLVDGNVAQKLAELKQKDKTLWEKIGEAIKNLLERWGLIRQEYANHKPNAEEAQFLRSMDNAFKKLQDMYTEAFVDAEANFATAAEEVLQSNAKPVAEAEIITDGAVVVAKDGAKFSIKSMKADIAEGKMFDDLMQYCGWTQARVNDLRNQLTALVAYMEPHSSILDMNETYGREGRKFSPYKPNSDPLYKISLDFSTLCSKRLLTQYVIEQLQLREDRPMTAEEQMAIRDMLIEYRKVEKGLQVACAMCYVEAARLKSPKQMQRWLNDPAPLLRDYFAKQNKEFNDSVKEAQADFKESKGYARNAPKKDMSNADRTALNKIGPKMREQYKPSAEEQKIIDKAKTLPNSTYLTAANLAKLSETDPEIYNAYTSFVRTATRSKGLETDEPYYYGDSTRENGNGIIVSDSFIEAVNRENGMRYSSWSDWRIHHMLDFITAVIDNSVRGAAMHGYTKFAEEVRVLGKTGMMFNLSGVAGTQTGLNPDGSLNFSPTESIDINEAKELREEFPEVAGLQCIGVSDEHIFALLRSDIIDYVIPYHISGLNKALRRMADIHGWKDYTDTQHAAIDKSAKDSGNEHWHEEPVFSEFFVGYDTGMTGVEAMQASAKRYVEMCKERGLKPKFEKFVNEPGYWKLLVDRKMINQKTGELIQQKPVTPTFDFDAIKAVVDRYVENYDSGMEARALQHVVDNWDSLPARIRELKKGKKTKPQQALDTLYNEMIAAQPVEVKESARDAEADEWYTDGAKFSERDTAPTFYSHMGKVVDAVKQEKLGAASVVSMLRGKGVKAEEIKWSGIEAWLEGKKSVTKAELQEFIRGSMLQIEEEILHDNDEPYTAEEQSQMAKFEAERESVVEQLKSEWKRIVGTDIPIRNFNVGLESAVVHELLDAITEAKAKTESARKYKAARDELAKTIKDSGHNFGYDDAFYALASAVDDTKGFLDGLALDDVKLTPHEESVLREFVKAKDALSKEPGIPMDKQRALIDIAARADNLMLMWNRVREARRERAEKRKTKWGEYKLEGGNNYRELLFKMPGADYSNDSMYVHWGSREGVLAHARVQDFDTASGKMLFVEEIQSDWHNAGKKHGYLKNGDKTASQLYDESQRAYEEFYATVEQMVYDNSSWEDDNAKHYAHPAVVANMFYGDESHFDEYKFTGAQKETIRAMVAEESARMAARENAPDDSVAPEAPFSSNYHEFVMKRLIRMAAEGGYDSIGWTTADIQSNRWSDEYAEGYRIEYDQDIPKFMAKYGKKWGAKVNAPSGSTAFVTDSGAEYRTYSMAQAGILREISEEFGYDVSMADVTLDTEGNKTSVMDKMGVILGTIEKKTSGINVWSMNITPAMKESVLYEGQPLYSDRDVDSVSSRVILSNAFAEIATNDTERKKIAEYQQNIQKINEMEDKLADIRKELGELSFSKGPRDQARIKALRDEATKTANRISNYDKILLRLEASKPLMDVLEREKSKAYSRASQKWKDRMEEARTGRSSAEIRRKIKTFKGKLENSLLNPTDRVYVPSDLVNAMIDVCNLIDIDTDLYHADGTVNKAQEKRNLTKEKLQNLKDEYEKLGKLKDPIYQGEFDEMVYTYLSDLKDKFSGKPLKEMSLDELTELYETLRAIDDTLRDARKLIGWGDAEDVYEAGNAIAAEQADITKGLKNGHRSEAQKARDAMLNMSLSPVRNVERMSGYHDDSYLLKLFKRFEQGIRKKNKFVMEAYKSFEQLNSGKEYENAMYTEVGGKRYEDVNGRKFGISKMQMMQAILSFERETANDLNHILNGGFTFADLDLLRKGKLRDAISEEHSHRVPNAVELVSSFSKELKDDKWCQEYMAAARKFFNETAKNAINETSMALKHRIIAKDKNYIPFEVDENFVTREISAENDIQQTINSYGMLKDLKDGAPQPLIVTGLNNILDRHIDQVGNVYGLAVEVRNFNKVWNVKSDNAANGNPTVKAAVQRNWGKEGVAHIEQAVKDIQGPRRNEQSDLYKKVKSGYIGATFLLNLSVVTKQIGSLYSATSMLKWRGPARQLANLVYTMAHHDAIAAEVDKYTATAWMRRQGLSDAEVHTLMTEGKKTWLGRLASKLPTAINPGKWITAMDHAVALSLWRYAKQDTAKRTGLTGEDLLKATAEFYDEVVENTQSMTDMLHRPEIQKRSDILSEAVAMFKTDLYQMSGQLQVTAGRYAANKTKENGRALARTVYSIAMSAMWAQMMTTLFALIRYKVKPYRDDDDELNAQSWLKRQSFALAGDLMGYIFPIFGGETIGFFENIMYGESDDIVDSIALTAINDLSSTMTTVASAVNDGEMPDPSQMKKLVVKSLQVFGVPANNIIRTYEAIHLHAKDIANGEFLSFEAGVDRTASQDINRIVKAMNDGRTNVAIGLYEDALADAAGADNSKDAMDKAKSSLKTALGDKYKDGEITAKSAINVLVKCFGIDKDEAEQIVSQWDFKVKYGYSWTDRSTAYKSGSISRSQAVKELMEVGGKTKEDAEEQVDEWQFELDYPELDGVVTYTQFKRWKADGKTNGVSIELFTKVAEYRDNGTSDSVRSQEEVKRYIMSVTSNWRVRHGLWCCFYKASTSPFA